MSDIAININIKDESANLFRRCIRKLLDGTFIIEEKEPKLFAFIERESNQIDIREYLKGMGFDLIVDTKARLAMLIEDPECELEVGLKRANILALTTMQYYMLLILWKVYLETYGISEHCAISRGDLIDKMKSYNYFISVPDFNNSMKLFKKHNLINYDENEKGEETMISLYPSLQFGWDIQAFQVIADEYIGHMEDEDDEDEPEGVDMSMLVEGDEE